MATAPRATARGLDVPVRARGGPQPARRPVAGLRGRQVGARAAARGRHRGRPRRPVRRRRDRPDARHAPDLALRRPGGHPLAARADGAAGPPGERLPIPDPRARSRDAGEEPRDHRARPRRRAVDDPRRAPARARGGGRRPGPTCGSATCSSMPSWRASSAAGRGRASSRPTPCSRSGSRRAGHGSATRHSPRSHGATSRATARRRSPTCRGGPG